MAGTEPHAWGTGRMDDITYLGLDVHKATVCVAIAESGRGGEIRQIGVFENRPEILCKMAARLGTCISASKGDPPINWLKALSSFANSPPKRGPDRRRLGPHRV